MSITADPSSRELRFEKILPIKRRLPQTQAVRLLICGFVLHTLYMRRIFGFVLETRPFSDELHFLMQATTGASEPKCFSRLHRRRIGHMQEFSIKLFEHLYRHHLMELAVLEDPFGESAKIGATQRITNTRIQVRNHTVSTPTYTD